MDPESTDRLKEGGAARPRRRPGRVAAQYAGLALIVLAAIFAASLGISALIGGGEWAESPGGDEAQEATVRVPDPAVPADGDGETDGDPVGAPAESDHGTEGPGGAPEPAAGTRDEAPREAAPLLALVIDDWGYGWEAAQDFLQLDVPLNIAVIPHLPYSSEHARLAASRGHQVILHLPMEPLDAAWDLGDGAVTTAMADAEIAREVERAYDSIPYISGINNHMGSKATADGRVVRAVLAAAKAKGAFFLDSRTTPDSVIGDIAAEIGIPFLENDRFVDPDSDPRRIRDRILLAADAALRRGWAVAIGHVRRATYEGLVAALPEIEKKGVRLAHLTEVLERVNPGWELALQSALPSDVD